MASLLDKYVFQALEAYPYDLMEAVEAINYALSYDEKNPIVLCLMGQIQAEALKDYEAAKSYYQQALAENIYCFDVYPNYINVLLWNEEYDAAARLIEFGLSVKGTDKGILYQKKALLLEHQKAYKEALKWLKVGKEHTYNAMLMQEIKEDEIRVKEKIPKKKKKRTEEKET
ncbi:hypothetical protein ACFSTE_08955 [Aquimarina hainanensis]|uniref:Tetratricopeptide repeat protein n=1 Tax=Aquimarina hainanensis TaxID=1578017 RepID=A0ABW5N5Y0_9FLAO|nr:hypothetical protein [Aquimarina sp. TRL1]QKX03882.1 hypothetical protein HN014_02830 [Aquimarina sp. TRL1]